MSECLVQQRVVELLRHNGVTGYALKEVEAAFERHPMPPPRLWELVVTGWGGVAPPESGVRLLESCSTCGHRVFTAFSDASKLVDPATWDGSDFFMVWPLPRFIFVTEKIARIVRSEELIGVELVEASQLRLQGDTLTPGLLSDWFPRDVAAKLGRAIGIQ
jgi:hypothetical protein